MAREYNVQTQHSTKDMIGSSSEGDISDTEDGSSLDFNEYITVHLHMSECSRNEMKDPIHRNDREGKDTIEGNKYVVSKTSGLTTCPLCQEQVYILTDSKTLKFRDALDTECLTRIFKEIKKTWIPTKLVVKSKGGLHHLPENIGRFHNLIKLKVRHNEIADLPASVERLKSLKVLDLAHNNLDEVPHVIYTLKSLEKLNLKNNRIRFISSSVLELENLTSLDVSLNPMISPSKAICAGGIDAIREEIRKYLKTAEVVTLFWNSHISID